MPKKSDTITKADIIAAEINTSTNTVANVLMDCYVHNKDGDTVRSVARSYGMNPLSREDAKLLRRNMGRDRFMRFKLLLKGQ